MRFPDTLVLADDSTRYIELRISKDQIMIHGNTKDTTFMSFETISQYSIDGLNIYQKLLDSKTKSVSEAEYYKVKNGIILLDTINKKYNDVQILVPGEPSLEDTLNDLNKSIEWHELTENTIKYFILNQRKDIVSPRDLYDYLKSELIRIEKGIYEVKKSSRKYNRNLIYYRDLGLYDLAFINEKGRTRDEILKFNKDLKKLLLKTKCDEREIVRSRRIIEALNSYLDKDSFSF